MGRNTYSYGPYLDNSWTSINTSPFGGVDLSFTFSFPSGLVGRGGSVFLPIDFLTAQIPSAF